MFAAVQYWRQSPRRPYGPSWSPTSRGVHVIDPRLIRIKDRGLRIEGSRARVSRASERAACPRAPRLCSRGGAAARTPRTTAARYRPRRRSLSRDLRPPRGRGSVDGRARRSAVSALCAARVPPHRGRDTGPQDRVPGHRCHRTLGASLADGVACPPGSSSPRGASSARRTVGPLARALNDRSLLVAPRALAEAARIVSKRSRGPRHCRAPCCDPPLEWSLAFHRLALCKRGDHAVHAVESATNVLLRAVCIQRSWL